MADNRAGPRHTTASTGIQRGAPSQQTAAATSRGAQPTGGGGAVRRNLFQGQLTRRPTPGTTTSASASSSASSSAAAGPSGGHHHHHHQYYQQGGGGGPSSSSSANTNTSAAETLRLDNVDVLSDTSDIVIRDPDGDFEIGGPPTPPPVDDPDEIAAPDDAQENARERQRLAEVIKDHHFNHGRPMAQSEELLEILRASMRAQAASLADDNWMYEAEDLQPPAL